MKQLSGTEMKRLHRYWRSRRLRRFALLLEGIASPFNLGAIVRTAAAYRIDHVYLAAMQMDPATPSVGKTALGTERYLSWSVHADADAAIAASRADGYALVGLELADGAEPIHETDLPDDLCLAIGHEDRGLSRAVLADCDAVVYLPQLGRVGSLNAATAASVAIWEVRRRDLAG